MIRVIGVIRVMRVWTSAWSPILLRLGGKDWGLGLSVHGGRVVILIQFGARVATLHSRAQAVYGAELRLGLNAVWVRVTASPVKG